jgi:hypothetical protein
MTDQAPDPARAQLLADWMDAVQRQEPTGDCGRLGCDGKLRPLPATVTGSVVFLDAECDACGRVVSSPNGKRTGWEPPGTVRPATDRWRELAAAGPDWAQRAAGDR